MKVLVVSAIPPAPFFRKIIPEKSGVLATGSVRARPFLFFVGNKEKALAARL
jgi:hypothetical protein